MMYCYVCLKAHGNTGSFGDAWVGQLATELLQRLELADGEQLAYDSFRRLR